MLMAGSCLAPWQIALVAALCTGLGEAFDPFRWVAPLGVPRLVLSFAAFFGAGLYVYQSARTRRMASRHMREIETEAELRRAAEQQLQFLVESSPATILTLDKNGNVLLANDAAHRLFGVASGQLQGEPIARFIPALASVPPLMGERSFFRTSMECRGRRLDGDMFQAQVWFSTYKTHAGPRLAAVVFDASDELRDREEFSLQQLLAGSKIAVGAVCHEMRNVCGAISAVQAKLALHPGLAANEDFRTLQNLVDGLGTIASLELQHNKPEVESVDVRAVLEQLRIVIEPTFREAGISILWQAADPVPQVWAAPQALLQAFLNIVKNSERAMARQNCKELTIAVARRNHSVAIQFMDTGHGVTHPERLFQPFQPSAHATGLGLYLSRAFIRAFKGDIEYHAQPTGSCFTIVLVPVETWKEESSSVLSAEPQPAAGD